MDVYPQVSRQKMQECMLARTEVFYPDKIVEREVLEWEVIALRNGAENFNRHPHSRAAEGAGGKLLEQNKGGHIPYRYGRLRLGHS